MLSTLEKLILISALFCIYWNRLLAHDVLVKMLVSNRHFANCSLAAVQCRGLRSVQLQKKCYKLAVSGIWHGRARPYLC